MKNYHSEFEKIIEKKHFSINAQNLLLNMLYQIEIGYKDYKIVKHTGITETQLIEGLIEIIDKQCEIIKIVEPSSENGMILTKNGISSIIDTKYKIITVLPIEKDILYALCQMNTENFMVDEKYYFLEKAVTNTLRNGNSINIKEIIRDFNGWSWNVEKNNIESFEYNIIFQTVRILVGYNFLYNWERNTIVNKDYLYEMTEILESNYGKNNGEEFYQIFIQLSNILSINNNKEINKYFFDEKSKISKELDLMHNKSKFLDKITEDKKKANIQIKEIDKILNNKDLLNKELEKNKKEYKTLNIDALKFILKGKRQKLIQQLSRYTKLMNPRNYTKNIENLENKIDILKKIDINILSQNWVKKYIIELQKTFLKCLKSKIEMAKTKVDLIEIMYHLRYYEKIPIDKDNKVVDIDELHHIIIFLEDILIEKSIKLKVLNVTSKNNNYNIEIIRKSLNTKIPNLENIELEIKLKYDKIQVFVYDGEVLDSNFEIEIDGAVEKVNIKTRRKFKLFI